MDRAGREHSARPEPQRKPERTTSRADGLQVSESPQQPLRGAGLHPARQTKNNSEKLPPAGLACDAAGAQGLERPLHSLAEHGGVPGRQGRGRCAVAQARALTPFHLNGKPEASRHREAAQEAAGADSDRQPIQPWPGLVGAVRGRPLDQGGPATVRRER